jgi:hypothetical protein
MYTQEYLAKDRHQERLRQAEKERAAHQVTELHKLERRQERRLNRQHETSHTGGTRDARGPSRVSSFCGLVQVAGNPPEHLGPERALALKLAQHADPRGGHPVDQHVGRGQVELAGDP